MLFFRRLRAARLWSCVSGTLLLLSLSSAHGGSLSLKEAERQALQNDHGARVLDARSLAFGEQAVAAESWGDPILSFGVRNLPGNDLDLLNQGMLELRLKQALPRGQTNSIARKKLELQGETIDISALGRRITLLRDVRLIWLDSWYWQQASQQLEDDLFLFESLRSITESMYSQGRTNQQDLLRAELELSRLNDRIVSFKTGYAQSKEQLSRLIGGQIVDQISTTLPGLSGSDYNNSQGLLLHPSVKMAELAIQQSAQDIAKAEEAYKPQWGVEFQYRREQNDTRATSIGRDRYSAFLTMDLPIFTDNRQDRQLSASKYRREANVHQKSDTLHHMKGRLQVEAARFDGLKRRLSLFQNQLLPQVTAQSEAALQAYQSDTSEFSVVVQAYNARLNINVEYARLQADALQSESRLRYLLPSSEDLQQPAKERKL